MDSDLCPNCQVNPSSIDAHTCPYKSELGDTDEERDATCVCCEKCEEGCKDSI